MTIDFVSSEELAELRTEIARRESELRSLRAELGRMRPGMDRVVKAERAVVATARDLLVREQGGDAAGCRRVLAELRARVLDLDVVECAVDPPEYAPEVIAVPCRDCGGSGRVRPAPDVVGGLASGDGTGSRPCAACAARTGIAGILARVGSWTALSWEEHIRRDFGEVAAGLAREVLRAALIPVEAAEAQLKLEAWLLEKPLPGSERAP